MRAITALRRRTGKIAAERAAVPGAYKMFNLQSRVASYAEIARLPVNTISVPPSGGDSDDFATALQNGDGTFRWMMGYDSLGEAPF